MAMHTTRLTQAQPSNAWPSCGRASATLQKLSEGGQEGRARLGLSSFSEEREHPLLFVPRLLVDGVSLRRAFGRGRPLVAVEGGRVLVLGRQSGGRGAAARQGSVPRNRGPRRSVPLRVVRRLPTRKDVFLSLFSADSLNKCFLLSFFRLGK